MLFNVTQCPSCESTFNTNSRVLAAAAGRVRCGACLHVFEAIDNFLIPGEADAAQNQDESVFIGNDPQEFFDPSSFFTRSALSETHSDDINRDGSINEKYLYQELKKSKPVNENFFATVAGELQERTEVPIVEDVKRPIDLPEILQVNSANESVNDELEEEILESFAADVNDTHALTTNNPADPSFEEHIEPEPVNAKEKQTENKESFLGSALSASFTFDPHASPEMRIAESEPDSSLDEMPASEPPVNSSAASDAEDEGPIIEAANARAQEVGKETAKVIRSRALEAELSDEESLEEIPRENFSALENMSTPVELLATKESHFLRSTLLFLFILLLSGLLSSQYLWQRMEFYSQFPQLRPLYDVACSHLSCALPKYADIDSIRSENLTVQTHPNFPNGLMINTVIRNTAAFEQPFPILILSFNNIENSIIALREFTSAEYLAPELHSIQTMPAKTPVQIGLAIMDPGPEAANYTLAFRWP